MNEFTHDTSAASRLEATAAALRSGRRAEGGFTILEVLIAVLVLSIGILGIFALQSVAITSNRTAYDSRAALQLAETTLERIERDSSMWTAIGGWPDGTWLQKASGTVTTASWTVPPKDGGEDNTALFNDLGIGRNTIAETGAESVVERNSRFCVQYRMGWIVDSIEANVQVRVLWPRTDRGESILQSDCGNLFTASAEDVRRHFYQVQVTGQVAQNDITRGI